MGRPRAIATRPRMRDSLPVAHVPCVRALRGSMGRVGVAAAFQRRHGRIVTAAQVYRLEWPTLCPAPSTPLTISRWLGSRQQAMLSPSRRVRAARPWYARALGCGASSASHLARRRRDSRPLVQPLGKPDGLSGRLPLCATRWVEFRNCVLQIYAYRPSDHGRAVS